MDGPVSRIQLPQNECLEEPCRMRQVPLCRARFRARLHHHVFRSERRAKQFTLLPQATELLRQGKSGGWSCKCGHRDAQTSSTLEGIRRCALLEKSNIRPASNKDVARCIYDFFFNVH